MKKIKRMLMFLLTIATLISSLPVTAEAKKIENVRIHGKYGSMTNPSDVCVSWEWNSHYCLHCRVGDTVTLIPDQEELKERIKEYNSGMGILGESRTDGKKFVWRSSNTNVATVNKKGKVKVKGNGYATITLSLITKSRTRGIDENGWTEWSDWKPGEDIFFYRLILSKPDTVLELKESNVKAIAKKSVKYYKENQEVPFARIKGNLQDNKELFIAYMEELKKCWKDEIPDYSRTWDDTAHLAKADDDSDFLTFYTQRSRGGGYEFGTPRYYMWQDGNFCYIRHYLNFPYAPHYYTINPDYYYTDTL